MLSMNQELFPAVLQKTWPSALRTTVENDARRGYLWLPFSANPLSYELTCEKMRPITTFIHNKSNFRNSFADILECQCWWVYSTNWLQQRRSVMHDCLFFIIQQPQQSVMLADILVFAICWNMRDHSKNITEADRIICCTLDSFKMPWCTWLCYTSSSYKLKRLFAIFSYDLEQRKLGIDLRAIHGCITSKRGG